MEFFLRPRPWLRLSCGPCKHIPPPQSPALSSEAACPLESGEELGAAFHGVRMSCPSTSPTLAAAMLPLGGQCRVSPPLAQRRSGEFHPSTRNLPHVDNLWSPIFGHQSSCLRNRQRPFIKPRRIPTQAAAHGLRLGHVPQRTAAEATPAGRGIITAVVRRKNRCRRFPRRCLSTLPHRNTPDASHSRRDKP